MASPQTDTGFPVIGKIRLILSYMFVPCGAVDSLTDETDWFYRWEKLPPGWQWLSSEKR